MQLPCFRATQHFVNKCSANSKGDKHVERVQFFGETPRYATTQLSVTNAILKPKDGQGFEPASGNSSFDQVPTRNASMYVRLIRA